jgi:hypothetical protein
MESPNLSPGQPQQQTASPSPKSNRNKKIGILLIVGPFVGLAALMFIYAIISFLFMKTGAGASMITLIQIINIILGLLGVVFVIGTIIGPVLGIVFLLKKN